MSVGPVWSRWMALPRLIRWMVPVALGAVAALGLAPFGLWFLTFLGLAGVAWLFLRLGGGADFWSGFGLGWRFGLGYFAIGLMWIVEPFLVDVARHGWMAPFALVLMAGGLALFWGAAFGIAALIEGRAGRRILALVVTMGLAEFARAYVLSGFPWGGFAQIWIGAGFGPAQNPAQILAWVGPHGLAVWTVAAAMLLAVLVEARGAGRIWALVPGVGMIAASVVLGLQREPTQMSGTVVRIVQPNAPQDQKWHPAHVWRFFDRQLALTSGSDAAASGAPDLIVWPESSIPPFLENAGAQLEQIAIAAEGVPVVAGVRRSEGLRYFNTMLVIGAGGDILGQYDKHHLVPFGEYMPLGRVAAWFGIYGLASEEGGGFSAGPGPGFVDLPGIGRALALICYEAVFAQDVNGAAHVEGAGRGDLILQITNDAWFGNWSGPYQHLAQARMRAIEQGLPLVRAANTGVSAMIGPDGAVLADLPLNTAGALDADLPLPGPVTMYSRTGDWPVFLLLLGLFGVLILHHLRRGGVNVD